MGTPYKMAGFSGFGNSPVHQDEKKKGDGFMNVPYRYPAGPTEKAKGYHGYKNFDSNIEKKEDAKGVTTNIKKPKVFKDGAKNKVHGVKNSGNWQPHPDAFKTKKSPVEQKAAKSNMKANTNMKIDLNLENKKALNQKIAKVVKKSKLPKNFNTKGSSGDTFKKTTKRLVNKATAPKNFNMTGSSKAGKFAKVAKKVVGKGGKFLGGKLLGVAGMMMATSSKADQPKGKKSEGEQIRNLLTKHKLKGGKK